jgi:hypothetical protein
MPHKSGYPGVREKAKARKAALEAHAAKGTYPTKEGTRSGMTRGPGAVAAANRFSKATNPAAAAIRANKRKYKDIE